MKLNEHKDFSTLLNKALDDWPKEINFGPLLHQTPGTSLYSVKGLYRLSDEISKPYLGASDEVLMRNIHDAIYEVLHDAAASCIRINLKQLRAETIQRSFESRLEYCLKQKNAGWTNNDKKLISKYFKDTSNFQSHVVTGSARKKFKVDKQTKSKKVQK